MREWLAGELSKLGTEGTVVIALTILFSIALVFLIRDARVPWLSDGDVDAELLAQLFRDAKARETQLAHSSPDLDAMRRRDLTFHGVTTSVAEHVSGRPLGTVVWDGGLLLAEYAADPTWHVPLHWHGLRVLELGAGTGVLGIQLAQRGAQVTLTDRGMLLPLLRENVRLNMPLEAGSAYVRELEWGHDGHLHHGDEFDVVVGADVMYVDEAAFAALVETLKTVARPGTVVLLAGAKRHKQEGEYLDRLREHFELEVLDEVAAAIAGKHRPKVTEDEDSEDSEDGGAGLRRRKGGDVKATVEWTLTNPDHAYIYKLTTKGE